MKYLEKLCHIEISTENNKQFCKAERIIRINMFNSLIKIKINREHFNLKYIYYKLLKISFGRNKACSIYLRKYEKDVQKALSNYENTQENGQSGSVWSMWWQDDIPPIIQICLNTIKQFYPNLIIITQKNVSEYIDIPEYMLKKFNDGIIALPHFSDYIRLCLLEKYGGMWIDSSCLMVDKVPTFITKQPFFILQAPDKKSISNFFIQAHKHNYIIKNLKLFIEKYYKKETCTIDYFLFHQYFMLSINKNNLFKIIYDNIIPDVNNKIKYLTDNHKKNADKDCWDFLKKTSYMYKIGRKSSYALENKNSWYWFIMNEYKDYIDTPETIAHVERERESNPPNGV